MPSDFSKFCLNCPPPPPHTLPMIIWNVFRILSVTWILNIDFCQILSESDQQTSDNGAFSLKSNTLSRILWIGIFTYFSQGQRERLLAFSQTCFHSQGINISFLLNLRFSPVLRMTHHLVGGLVGDNHPVHSILYIYDHWSYMYRIWSPPMWSPPPMIIWPYGCWQCWSRGRRHNML